LAKKVCCWAELNCYHRSRTWALLLRQAATIGLLARASTTSDSPLRLLSF
jgi:hypothetical protein